MSNRIHEKMAEAVARLGRMLEHEREPTAATAAARVVVRLWPEVLARLDNGTVTAAELYAAEQRALEYAERIQDLEETLQEHEAHGRAYRKQIARDSWDNGLCEHECPGYREEPFPGRLWPGEDDEPYPAQPASGAETEGEHG